MIGRGAFAAAVLVLLAGCAGDPGVAGDRASPKFQADLKTCRASAAEQVRKEDAKRFPRWVVSPFTAPGQRHRAVRACMEGKGYAAAP